jgi:hypothetical protein
VQEGGSRGSTELPSGGYYRALLGNFPVWTTPLTQPCSFVVVGNTNENVNINYFFDGLDNGNNNGYRILTNSAPLGISQYAGNNNGTDWYHSTYNTPSANLSTFGFNATPPNNISTIALGTRSPQATNAASYVGSSQAKGLTIGNTAAPWASSTYSLKGPILLLSVYDHQLTTTERDTIATYITSRFGIAMGP